MASIRDAVVRFQNPFPFLFSFTNVQIKFAFFHVAKECTGGAEGQDEADCDNYCQQESGQSGKCDFSNPSVSIPCVCIS